MCMYICRIYVFIYACACIYIYIYMYMYIYTYLYSYTYIHIFMYTYVFVFFSYVYMYKFIYLSMYYESIWIHLSHMWTRIQIHKFSSMSFKASSLRTRRVLSFDYEHTSSKIIPAYKNPSVTDSKSRSRMLQIGLLLWVCLSCRDLHRPYKFVLKAAWNKKIVCVPDAKTIIRIAHLQTHCCYYNNQTM